MTEIERITTSMQEVLSGDPWYGNALLTVLDQVDAARTFHKPGRGGHSMIELLYHMVTWAEFTQERLERDQQKGDVSPALDWRDTDAEIHTWNNGVAQLTAIINKTIAHLKTCTDALLDEPVDMRTYNFRILLNGNIQHLIYHLAQIAYINTTLH